jgi:hypothetical protein
MSSALPANRSQAWFRPGRYVAVTHMPVSHIRGIEALAHTRGGVQVAKGTIHGTPDELRALAAQLVQAARLASLPRRAQPPVSRAA